MVILPQLKIHRVIQNQHWQTVGSDWKQNWNSSCLVLSNQLQSFRNPLFDHILHCDSKWMQTYPTLIQVIKLFISYPSWIWLISNYPLVNFDRRLSIHCHIVEMNIEIPTSSINQNWLLKISIFPIVLNWIHFIAQLLSFNLRLDLRSRPIQVFEHRRLQQQWQFEFLRHSFVEVVPQKRKHRHDFRLNKIFKISKNLNN